MNFSRVLSLLTVLGFMNINLLAYDVVIYGGTPAAITAALQVKKMGKSVVLVSPDRTLGGVMTNGLSSAETGMNELIGGIARIFIIVSGDITRLLIPGSGKTSMNLEIVDRVHPLRMVTVGRCGFMNRAWPSKSSIRGLPKMKSRFCLMNSWIESMELKFLTVKLFRFDVCQVSTLKVKYSWIALMRGT